MAELVGGTTGADGPPQFVLIVGGPERVPFHLQAMLATGSSVGRLAFDDVGALDVYVKKVRRLEADRVGSTRRQALLFATDRGEPDPTYYSHRYMAMPIERHLRETVGVPVRTLCGERATTGNLLDALTGERSALIYTATHGAVRPRADLEVQRAVNGAIVCTPEPGATQQALLTAGDVPGDDVPVAEGAIVFQFACFGAGSRPKASTRIGWVANCPSAKPRSWPPFPTGCSHIPGARSRSWATWTWHGSTP